jgi:FdhD protein
MGRSSTRTPVVRWDVRTGARTARPDTLAVEEPLEIRVEGRPVVTTMRTPGDDVDLALGLLLAEGLLARPDDVASGRHCTDVGEDGRPTFNVLELRLRPGVVLPDLEGRRTFGMTSACGVCGSASIDAVRARTGADLSGDDVRVDAAVLAGLPDRLREAQRVFERTGGLHAAGLATADGDLLAVREDVGRHNAVDKVLGWAARERGWPLRGHVLVVSGRASFELAQKAWVAGVPVLAAVSAPSSLAVELARAAGMTLLGFVRGTTMNGYAGTERVVAPGDGAAAAAPAGARAAQPAR